MAHRSERFLRLDSFASDNSKVELWQLVGFSGSFQFCAELMRASHPQAVLVERACMLIAANKRIDFGHARQVRRVQAADSATADDADFFHWLCFSIPSAPA